MGEPLPHPDDPTAGATATIKTLVVTDLVGSTRLFATLGDRRAAALSARHERLARDLLARCGGREIDKTDGFLLLFDRTLDAVRFALDYHRSLATLSEAEQATVEARVGIHLGEVILRPNPSEDVARGAKPVELEGYAKPVAARVMSLAKARQTLLTRGAFDLARQAASREPLAAGELRWLAHGPYVLKGVEEPVEIFEVGERGFAPLLVPKSTAKARRAVSAADELTLGWRPAPGLEVPRRPHWRLAEKLGAGGFGEVWRAAHRKTGENRVFKFCYEPERLRSLQREVTLFRLLKEGLGAREDIARILDWNFDEAPYFLECEYTEGGDLLEWVADQGGVDRVPLTTRLELVAQVAEALAAAHSVGVLHKDVKPSNVLVTTGKDGAPKVRLTDFGIGVVTDREVLARRGITVYDLTEMVAEGPRSTGGTHLYMAPELVEGRAPSVQADVYALGVLLFQLVTGDLSRALAHGWRRDVPDELLQEDLEAMVDGRPERRLRDVQEVARRLRTLEERRARREAERRERAQREAERLALERAQRRRKTALAIAAASLVVLVVVAALALQAVDARSEAERRRGQAEKLIGFMVGDLREKLEPIGRLDVLDEVGAEALEYFESVPREDLTAEELFRRSETLRQIGEVRVARGDLPAAMEAFQESLRVAEALVERSPENGEWQKGLGASHYWVGYVHWRQKELDRAEEEFRRYLAIAEELAAREPDDPEWQLELAYTHSNIGSVLQARGDLTGALEQFQETLSIKRRLVDREPDRADYRIELATSLNLAASALQELGRLDSARDLHREELRINRAFVEQDPQNARRRRQLALTLNYSSALAEHLGDLDQALVEALEAKRITDDLVALDPSNSRWQRESAINRLRLARVYRKLDRQAEALELAIAAQEVTERLVREDPSDLRWRRDLADAHRVTGWVQLHQGDLDRAVENLTAAVGLCETLLEGSPGDRASQHLLGSVSFLMGQARTRAGEANLARTWWERAASVLEPLAGESSQPEVLDPLVRSLTLLGRVDEAVELSRRLLETGYRDPEYTQFVRDHSLISDLEAVSSPHRAEADPKRIAKNLESIPQGETHERGQDDRHPVHEGQTPGETQHGRGQAG